MSGRDSCTRSLRDNPAVVSLEQTDIRTLDPARLAEPPDFVTVDVSFISLKLVLPALDRLVARPAQLVALIKPQFEAGRALSRRASCAIRRCMRRCATTSRPSSASLGWT